MFNTWKGNLWSTASSVAVILALAAGCAGDKSSNTEQTGSSGLYGSSSQPAAVKAAPEPIEEGPQTVVEIETNFGTMTAVLYNGTPKHRDNFIKLAEEGFYDDLLFHRIIRGFMIHGGDPDSRGAAPGISLGQGGPGYTVPAEIRPEYIHKKGALAAARLGDQINPSKASSGSQFYIVQGSVYTPESLGPLEQQRGYTGDQKNLYFSIGGTPQLDGGYTVFGEVIQGLDVLDKIAATKTAPGDRPLEDVKMKVRVLKD